MARLRQAAHIVEAETDLRKISLEELIVAGAMSFLDWSQSRRKAASESIGAETELYARRKVTFAEHESGTHDALQSPDTAPSKQAA